MTGICAVTPAFSSRRYDEDDRLNPDEVRSSFLTPLLSALGWNMPRAHQHAISTGHTGVIDAVAAAERVIADRRLDRLVIACADSYLDLLSLEWLDAADRLKADDNPIGLIPGEAGVCILVESPDAARRRNARVLAHINASSLAVARARPLSDDAVTGESTAEAVRQVLQMIQVASFDGMAIGDLNGESWRSQDWGFALVRLGPLLSERVRWFFPCDSLGETGAASAGVAICVGSLALARGYADSDQVLIIASGEDGAAASVVLGAADRVDTT
jgi:3-oxoacyl-[acyl-carrier-protein] synthase-1